MGTGMTSSIIDAVDALDKYCLSVEGTLIGSLPSRSVTSALRGYLIGTLP